jgi:hypothetical protein
MCHFLTVIFLNIHIDREESTLKSIKRKRQEGEDKREQPKKKKKSIKSGFLITKNKPTYKGVAEKGML